MSIPVLLAIALVLQMGCLYHARNRITNERVYHDGLIVMWYYAFILSSALTVLAIARLVLW